jgi:hypothetical protein
MQVLEDGKEILSRIVKVKEHQLNLPVATKENAFEILWQIHSVQRGHCGVDKTEDLVKHRNYGIPKKIVSFFVRTCLTCQLKMVQHTQPRLKPLRSDGFMSRIQIDLVDMRHNVCSSRGRVYKWIAHVEDHFSKWHIMWPQEQKSADEVVHGLRTHVFAVYGLPKILQSEFKNSSVVRIKYEDKKQIKCEKI